MIEVVVVTVLLAVVAFFIIKTIEDMKDDE
jgi:hypothetical protein